MYPLVLLHSALLSKCSTGGSLLQIKKEAILPFKEELENMKSKLHILKIPLQIITQVLYHKTRVLYQIPLSTTNAVYCGTLTIHESNSCHKTTVQNDV
jgi:hypothetical protein